MYLSLHIFINIVQPAYTVSLAIIQNVDIIRKTKYQRSVNDLSPVVKTGQRAILNIFQEFQSQLGAYRPVDLTRCFGI